MPERSFDSSLESLGALAAEARRTSDLLIEMLLVLRATGPEVRQLLISADPKNRGTS